MATVVYGGSPRHRSAVTQSQTSSLHRQHTPPYHHHSNIIVPPSSYLSSSSVTTSSYVDSSSGRGGGGGGNSTAISQQPTPIVYHSLRLSDLHGQHHRSDRHNKRKSAVEMLAESKPFYVKSEIVLDRHQHLSNRSSTSSGSYVLSPSRTLPPQHRPTSRRTVSSGSDLLQNKLRKLLNTEGREKRTSTDALISPGKYHRDMFGKYDNGTYHGGKPLSVHVPRDYTMHPDQQSDVSVFFPSAFLSPQSVPPHPVDDDDLYTFEIDDGLVLTDDYRAISPPAEYAENSASPNSNKPAPDSRYNYHRSYSQNVEGTRESGRNTGEDDEDNEAYTSSTYNINSHKSLPDLHSQISRHSPHSEALSCCSRGNRSNRSSNRDSGGSSGHYTHRSEPSCKNPQHPPGYHSQYIDRDDGRTLAVNHHDFRRDSGSSTQHSGNSYYPYGIPPPRYDCVDCRHGVVREETTDIFNFTPEVPEAFKDNYKEKKKFYDDRNETRQYITGSGGTSGLTPLSPLSPTSPISPPLGTFKRQKCLRFKPRGRYSVSPRSTGTDVSDEQDRRPILRSKSDISDRYWNRLVPVLAPEDDIGPRGLPLSEKTRQKADSLSDLEKFFDRLGLDDERFKELVMPRPRKRYGDDDGSGSSSPVFFSDVSTVDSNQLPDSTENNATNPALYRPSEPPSIIERNARIIKWLCNIKKTQAQLT